MKSIEVKRVIFTTLIFIFCTKLHAQKQWNLNAYHNYSTYFDLNCSLNGESNGTEAFLFYADSRSESKISFTVNYTITDNCGKSHSGSWSTNIIQAGQRASTFKSVYTGCAIIKGKGHLVKNITCTVSDFKDLSKKELNNSKTSNEENSASLNSNVNTQSNNSGQKGATQNTISESERRYDEQANTVEYYKKQSIENAQQTVNAATELGSLLSNTIETNRRIREKKEMKKEAEAAYERKQQEIKKLNLLGIIRDNIAKAEKGDVVAMNTVADAYLRLNETENARFWYFNSAHLNSDAGFLGLANIVNAGTNSRIKIIQFGKIRNEMVDSLKIEVGWLKKAASLGNVEAFEKLKSYHQNYISFNLANKLEIIYTSNLHPWKTLKDDKDLLDFFTTEANKMQVVPLVFLNSLYHKKSRAPF